MNYDHGINEPATKGDLEVLAASMSSEFGPARDQELAQMMRLAWCDAMREMVAEKPENEHFWEQLTTRLHKPLRRKVADWLWARISALVGAAAVAAGVIWLASTLKGGQP